jgi:hypothetical protein
MATRINPKHDDSTRQKIQTSQLINRLNLYALGEKGPQGETIDLSQGQLKAMEILLRKSLPDLAAVQHTGDDGGPIKMVIEWNKTNSPSES